MISVSAFQSNLSYICMVVVPMGRCRLFVVVLVPLIVLMRVGDIPVSQCAPSISLSAVDCIV